MTSIQEKIIKPKLGLLELAKQLGSVSQACNVMGYSRDSFNGSKNCTNKARRGSDGPQSQETDPQEPRAGACRTRSDRVGD